MNFAPKYVCLENSNFPPNYTTTKYLNKFRISCITLNLCNLKFSISFSEKGEYFIDFKNGNGDAGVGKPKSDPDVIISMNEVVFLQLFNMELSPEWAYFIGKIGISGSVSTALKLKTVLKAAAESHKNPHKISHKIP